ncbi:MAG: ferritin [candidate division KSB1 bacterium]|nr:ferritin [candidate division KSB1 bacterium]
MISKEMEKAINEQINKELYSSYLYLSMASFLEADGLDGMANFMKAQAQEEVEHAMKFYGYVNEQGGRVILDAIEKPKAEFKDVKEIFTLSFEHEKYVTGRIHSLIDLALKENDHATKTFLDWYVTEQVEEEATMNSILDKLDRIGTSGQGLLMLDAQLGQRRAPAGEGE